MIKPVKDLGEYNYLRVRDGCFPPFQLQRMQTIHFQESPVHIQRVIRYLFGLVPKYHVTAASGMALAWDPDGETWEGNATMR